MKIEITEDERQYLIDKAVDYVLNGRDEEKGGLLRSVRSAAKKHVEKLLEERAGQAVQEAIAKGIEARVEAALEAGIPTFDRYGNRAGVATVGAAILNAMEEKVASDYNKPSETMIQRFIRNKITEKFDRDLDEAMKTAKEQIKAAVDAKMGARLAETLKHALGLR